LTFDPGEKPAPKYQNSSSHLKPAGFFEGVGRLEQASLVEVLGEDLHAHGKVRLVSHFAAGDGEAGNTGEAGRNGVDVGEVHLERIVHALAELEGRNR
jgi:hypothetical protein